MNARWKRLLTVVLLLAMCISPSAAVLAEDGQSASPGVVETEGDASPSVNGTPESDALSPPTGAGFQIDTRTGTSEEAIPFDLSPTDFLTVKSISHDGAVLTVSLTLNPGFSAHNGDQFRLNFYQWGDGWIQLDSMVSSSNPAVVAYGSTYEIGPFFFDDVTVTGEPEALTLLIDAPVDWDECELRPDTFTANITMQVYTDFSVSEAQTVVYGAECIGAGGPTASRVEYQPTMQMLAISLDMPQRLIAGAQLVVTWPTDQLTLTPGRYRVFAYNLDVGEVQIGEVIVGEGVLTFTVIETNAPDSWHPWASISIPATLTLACEPGQIMAETGEMTYVVTPGRVFTDPSITVLCDGTSPAKTGAWGADENGEYILWTIETGTTFPRAWVHDYNSSGWLWYDCSSLTVDSDNAYTVWCDEIAGEGFSVTFTDDDTVNATITIKTYTVEPMLSYTNCVRVVSYAPGWDDDYRMTTAGTGWGGETCYEIFRDGGGDVITKSVDKATAVSGETITYTVNVTTTGSGWSEIEIIDELPVGFAIDADSITCASIGSAELPSPCFVLDGSRLTVLVTSSTKDMPAAVTLTFSGTVTGEPTTEIANIACSQRYGGGGVGLAYASAGDSTIPGGGRICDSAVTTIIAATPTPTPTNTPSPTATAEPTSAPTGTPATPAPVTPTATTAVTELPSTGTNGGSHAGWQLLTAALVTSVMMAAVGIRTAHTRK